ncbi:hypothetical protein [Archaeoglobus veneficus]|uniref:hypothetical protein n=1 Tax=Archaeoglobus veneficus TaxID=58290 RepID=UPI000A514E09|nr:hypothetical protein [Archaeoglobus veneficus]
MYCLVEFDGKRLYQPDITAITIDYAISMSYRDSRQRMAESPSHSTIWRRVQELSYESKFEYDDFVSADGTKLHVNPKSGSGKLEVKVVAGKSVAVGVNESYKQMKDRHSINAAIVGDADIELNRFNER